MNILRKKIKCSNYGHSIHPFVHFCDMMSNFTSLRQVFFPLNFKIWGNLRYIKCFCFKMGSSLCLFLSITYVHFYVACWCLINRLLSLIIGCLKVKWKKFYSTVFPKGNNIDQLIHLAQNIILNSLLGNHKKWQKFWPYAVHLYSPPLFTSIHSLPPAGKYFYKYCMKTDKQPTRI